MNTSSFWKSCLHPKVLIGLGVLAVAIVLLFPKFAAAVPLLLVLVCPVSMALMMRGMRHGEHHSQSEKEKP
jgi:hypothetical protein